VIQQGMSPNSQMARRYHWHSGQLQSFVEEPHAAVCGENVGPILNLTAREAASTRAGMLGFTHEKPELMMQEIQQLLLPSRHEVQAEDVDLKRLGTVLWMAHEQAVGSFEELLLLQGTGPRTIQSLALVSEVIHGTPARFKDPARFAFAHGGKDGHPFPVPVKVYDETIATLQTAVHKAKLGNSEKQEAIKALHTLAVKAEKDFVPNNRFEELVQQERDESWQYGGRTVFGKAQPPKGKKGVQLRLF
jgi:hypothetical protein